MGYDEWAKPVSAVLDIKDICIAYAEPAQAAGLAVPSHVPEPEEPEEVVAIKIPEIDLAWVEKAGGNVTFVQELLNETQKTVTKIKKEDEKRKEVESGASNSLAGLVVAAISMLFAVVL